MYITKIQASGGLCESSGRDRAGALGITIWDLCVRACVSIEECDSVRIVDYLCIRLAYDIQAE
jgi:hypothetical protein